MAEIGAELSGNELDILAALWAAPSALKLAEIHRRINERRVAMKQAPIQPTTVSTYLRSMTDRGLLNQVTVGTHGPTEKPQTYGSDVRGLIPTSRSPKTGYEAAHGPGVVLEQTFRALTDAYPPHGRWQALLDFARVMGLPQETVDELEKWLKKRVPPA